MHVTMQQVLAIVLFVGVCVMGQSVDGEARLLASKNVLNQYLVQGRDLTVEYKLYNIGESTAFDVTLTDDSFPEAEFAHVQGNLQASWERIAPSTNASHIVVLQPLKGGYFNFTAATVTYRTAHDSQQTLVGYTTAPGEGGIVTSIDYERRFSPHVTDWAVFAVMTLPSLGIPFMLWYRSKSRYPDIPKQKKH